MESDFLKPSYSVNHNETALPNNPASVYVVFGKCKRKIHDHIFCSKVEYFLQNIKPKLPLYEVREVVSYIDRLERLNYNKIEQLDQFNTVHHLEKFTIDFLNKDLKKYKNFLKDY